MEASPQSGLRSLARRDPVLLIVALMLAGGLATLPHPHQLAVAAALRSSVLAPVFWVRSRTSDLHLTRTHVQELRAERDSLALRLLRYQGVSAENQRLRGLIGLTERMSGRFVPANLHPTGRVGEMVKRSFILDLGAAQGVGVDAPVVAPEGLVGVVRSTTGRRAGGDFWTHPDFRVSAMTEDGHVFGIIEPLPGTPPRMKLEGAPYQAELEPGTRVLTSGLGGVFPRGIPVGRVSRLIEAQVGWAKSYLVEPAVYPEGLREVMVLVDSVATARDLSSVWSPVPSPGEQPPGEQRP